MPNHCFNYVTITGAGTAAIKKKLGSRKVLKEGILRHLVPMPKVLEGNISGGLETYYKAWVASGKPETIEIGESKISLDTIPEHHKESYRKMFTDYENALQETGFTSWYDWCIQNWGSKWGFYEVEVESFRKDEIRFRAQSAWGPPCEGLRTLSKTHDVEIEIKTEEEAWQFSFRGSYYPSGLAVEEEMPGHISPGEYPTIDKRRFEKFKDLIYYTVSEDEYKHLGEMTYQEYKKWNKV